MKKMILALLVGAGGLSVGLSQAQAAGGAYCREYTQVLHVAGTVQQGYGTACLQPDGSWKVVRSSAAPVENPVVLYKSVQHKRPQAKVYVAPRAPVVLHKKGRQNFSRNKYYRSGRRHYQDSHFWH